MDRTGSIARLIEHWFRETHRTLPWRATYDPYQVWVSEVMLQQTRMQVVLPFFARFIDLFPDIQSLAAASVERVVTAWSGLGYYRRARMLQAAAADVMQRFDGCLPRSVEGLRSIAGIGRYTAGAIASIAYGVKAPIVDGNVARVLARVEGLEYETGSRELMTLAWRHAEALVTASSSPRDLNQGMMEIGALICRPVRPKCSECPLRQRCRAFSESRTEELPLRRQRPASRALAIPLLLVSDGRGRFLMRRESGPLMTAMLHFPHGAPVLFDAPPLIVTSQVHVGSFRHTVTNRRIRFDVYRAEIETPSIADREEYCWVTPHDVTALPHPSYVTKALKFAQSA